MSDHDPKLSVNPGYALGQLHRALRTAAEHPDLAVRERAATKIRRWQQVTTGIASGSLTVGSRTPVAGTPAWATLEVAHGGFATGALLAGGPLREHETALLARVPRGAATTERAALNGYYTSDEGQRELVAMLRDGRYRVQVPEEGALLVVAWLLERGDAARALDVLDAIAPFADRLRFYPVPDALPLVPSAVVRLRTVAQTTRDLAAVRPRPQIARMNETLRFWHAQYDRAVALFLETLEGPTPTLRTDAEGDLVRRADGQSYVEGGWPCRTYPEGWRERAQALLDDYDRARKHHALCRKPDAPKENYARLRGYLATCVRDPRALTGRDVGYVRKILASFVTRHGAPASPRHQRVRAAQAAVAALPSNSDYSRVLVARLGAFPPDGGLSGLDAVSAPLGDDEAAQLGTSPGMTLPPSLLDKVTRALEAPVEELVERGVITSGEVLAIVLPQITAQVRAAGFTDPHVRRLYGEIYAAFRRRRSLLLVNLAKQVQLEELPWVAALTPFRSAGLDERARARETLRSVSALAVASFPEVIVPNKLLQEMHSLAVGAGLALPLVEEVAADIFMGTFSEKYLRAAQVAARMLQRTWYAKYYGIPCERVLALDDVTKQYNTPVSPGFVALCRELAAANRHDGGAKRSFVAGNGTVIEQEQVLTTHNLAVLFEALELRELLGPRLPDLARQCFTFVCRQHQMKVDSFHARLVSVKNCAYAWRQMLFFLSVADAAGRAEFLSWMDTQMREADETFQRGFAPAVDGLRLIAAGGAFDAEGCGGPASAARRLLGWTSGKHWLMA